MNTLRREKDIFLTALMFFTRVPVPQWAGYSYDPAYMPLSSKYLSLVGLIVGGATGLSYWIFSLFLPPPLAVVLSMLVSIMLTGGFHEDGLADVCDGFFGGMTKGRVLEIMKDSRLGTYGTLGLILILALKGSALILLSPTGLLPLILVVAHTLSRLMSITLMATHSYARDEESKAKPATSTLSLSSLLVASFFGIVPLLLLPLWGWLIFVPVVFTPFLLGRWFQQRIGGYTGDCLGAVQQVSEVIAYIGLVAIFV